VANESRTKEHDNGAAMCACEHSATEHHPDGKGHIRCRAEGCNCGWRTHKDAYTSSKTKLIRLLENALAHAKDRGYQVAQVHVSRVDLEAGLTALNAVETNGNDTRDAARWRFVRDRGLVWADRCFGNGCTPGRVGNDYATQFVDQYLGRPAVEPDARRCRHGNDRITCEQCKDEDPDMHHVKGPPDEW
jgi:hypothetical protein